MIRFYEHLLISSALGDIIGTLRQHWYSPTSALADIGTLRHHRHLPTASALSDISTCQHQRHLPITSALTDIIGTLRQHRHLPTSTLAKVISTCRHYQPNRSLLLARNTTLATILINWQFVLQEEVLMSPTAVNSRCFTVPSSNLHQ